MRSAVPLAFLLCCTPPRDAPPDAAAPPVTAPSPPPAPPFTAPSPPWRPLLDLAHLPDPPKLAPDEGLLTAVLGPSRLRACHGAPSEILPVLSGGYAGSFTRPSAAETAYLIRFVPCATPSLALPPAPLLILAKAHRPVLNTPVTADRLVPLPDLAGDGRDALALLGNARGKTTVRIVTAAGGVLTTLFDAADAGRAVLEDRATAAGLAIRARN